MKRKIKILFGIILLLIAVCLFAAFPEIKYQNQGDSKAFGSVRNGTLENAYLFPYQGKNYHYFSLFSYYILNNAYTHSSVFQTVIDAYNTCLKSCPNTEFRLMECSNRNGGQIPVHRTHQNGMSIDFMVPKINKGQQSHFFDKIGIFHYFLEFNDHGKLTIQPSVQIDFEAVAKHLLALHDAATNNGLRIRKVIFRTELLDELLSTKAGTKLKQRKIRFISRLDHIVNVLHDDHYHVDFEFL